MSIFRYPQVQTTITGGATEAKQDTIILELQDIDANTLTNATETTLAALNTKVTAVDTDSVTISAALPAGTNNIGDVDVVSSVLPTGAATEATLSTLDGKVTACDTGAVTVSSSALPTGAATSANQATIISELQRLETKTPVDFLDSGLVDASSTNITTAGLTVVASLAAGCSEIEIVEDIGEFMALTDGADTVLAYLPLGGGRVKITVASSTALKLASLTGSSITIGNIAINFLD